MAVLPLGSRLRPVRALVTSQRQSRIIRSTERPAHAHPLRHAARHKRIQQEPNDLRFQCIVSEYVCESESVIAGESSQ